MKNTMLRGWGAHGIALAALSLSICTMQAGDERTGIAIYNFTIVEKELLTTDNGAEPQTVRGRKVTRAYMVRDLSTGYALFVAPNKETRSYDSGVYTLEMAPWSQTDESGKITEHLIFACDLAANNERVDNREIQFNFVTGRAKLHSIRMPDRSRINLGPLPALLRGTIEERQVSNREATREWSRTWGRSAYRMNRKLTAAANDQNQQPRTFGGNTWVAATLEFGAACIASYLTDRGYSEGDIDIMVDEDGDGYFRNALDGQIDFEDLNPLINPGALEIPGNGVDDNCNGLIDEITGGGSGGGGGLLGGLGL